MSFALTRSSIISKILASKIPVDLISPELRLCTIGSCTKVAAVAVNVSDNMN
jgi:hypothetical protein